jgi:hypothetical protein
MPQMDFLTRDYASPPHQCVIGLTDAGCVSTAGCRLVHELRSFDGGDRLAAYLVSSIQPLGRVGPLTNLNLIQRIRDSGEPAKQPEFKYGAQIQLCASD